MSATTLTRAVAAAAARSEVLEQVRALYVDLRAEIDLRRPVCISSGRCCKFEVYGHRLFVTTMELAVFTADLAVLKTSVSSPWDGTGCAFQRQGLCSVHGIRPFGCRMFFCDAGSTQWQNDTYERYHDRLKRLHDELGVPYLYVEWRQALRELGIAAVTSEAALAVPNEALSGVRLRVMPEGDSTCAASHPPHGE